MMILRPFFKIDWLPCNASLKVELTAFTIPDCRVVVLFVIQSLTIGSTFAFFRS